MKTKVLNLISAGTLGLTLLGCNSSRSFNNTTSSSTNQPALSSTSSALSFTQISEGYASSCALDTDGHVWCWGDNSLGQVGVGSTAIQQYYHPEPVQTSVKFSSISIEGKTACALASSGDIWCWGDNSYGQVGSGSDAPQFDSPQLVHSEVKFTALARGVNSACALDQTGATWCWGHNGAGQIGNGSTDYSAVYNTPQRIARNIGFDSLAVGLSTVCALDASGSPWCWGDNASGKIDATSNILYNEPTKLNLPAGVAAFTKIAVGDSMTCGIDQSGDIWCWGANNYGQLGNGTNINSPGIPQLVVAPGVAFKKLALGIRSSCAIDSNNNTWCWGANSYYQIGNGKTNYSFSTPQKVQATAANFSSITVGLYTACVLDANGAAWCWGSNSLGQIGNNSTAIAKFATPQAVTAIVLQPKEPTQTSFKGSSAAVPPSLMTEKCTVKVNLVLSFGLATKVYFDGVEQPQCEDAYSSYNSCSINETLSFSYNFNLDPDPKVTKELQVDDAKYLITGHC